MSVRFSQAIKDTKAYKPAQDKLVSSAADDDNDNDNDNDDDDDDDDNDDGNDNNDDSEPKKLLPQLSFLSRIRQTVEKLSGLLPIHPSIHPQL